MKTLPSGKNIRGFTLIEVLVILAILVVLAAMLRPAEHGSRRARVAGCLSNLRQISIGFTMYEEDHGGRFPMAYLTNGNWIRSTGDGKVFPFMQKISPYCGNHPAILVCPSDAERQRAANFETLTDLSISYFLNTDASATNSTFSIIAGDRNLEAADQPVRPGLFILTTNLYLRWTDKAHVRRGCLGFADGHAQFAGTNLNSIIQSQPLAINRLCVP